MTSYSPGSSLDEMGFGENGSNKRSIIQLDEYFDEPHTKKQKNVGSLVGLLRGSRLIVLVGASARVSEQFLNSKIPYPDSVLKYIFLRDHTVIIEFLETYYATMFLYMYYDTGISLEDGSVLTVEYSDNAQENISCLIPENSPAFNPSNRVSINNFKNYSIMKKSGKVLFCLIYDPSMFQIDAFGKHGRVVKIFEIPQLDRLKRVLVEFENETDCDNVFEKLKNHQHLKLYKSKITTLSDEEFVNTSTKSIDAPPSVNEKNNNLVLQVTGFTSSKVNCDVMFILMGVYGDVLKTKITTRGPKPIAYIQFKDLEGANRALRFLGKGGTPCPLYGDNIEVSPASISEIEEQDHNDDGEEFKSYSNSPLHRFTRNSTGRIKNIDHICAPNRVLCISNINIDTQNSDIEHQFAKFNLKVEHIKVFGHKPKLGTKMGLVTFPSTSDAVTALVECHDIKLDNFHININFAEKQTSNSNQNNNYGHQRNIRPSYAMEMGGYSQYNAPRQHMSYHDGNPQYHHFAQGGNRSGSMTRGSRERGTYYNYNPKMQEETKY